MFLLQGVKETQTWAAGCSIVSGESSGFCADGPGLQHTPTQGGVHGIWGVNSAASSGVEANPHPEERFCRQFCGRVSCPVCELCPQVALLFATSPWDARNTPRTLPQHSLMHEQGHSPLGTPWGSAASWAPRGFSELVFGCVQSLERSKGPGKGSPRGIMAPTFPEAPRDCSRCSEVSHIRDTSKRRSAGESVQTATFMAA